jgi:hypothetical protein
MGSSDGMGWAEIGRATALTMGLAGMACGPTSADEDAELDGTSGTTEDPDPQGDPQGSTGTTSADPSTSSDTDPSDTAADDDPPDPPLLSCEGLTVSAEVDPGELPQDYGFTTEPPMMALAESVYGYFVHTRIGGCSTDRVQWSLDVAPSGAALELAPGVRVEPGELRQWDDGGDAREQARLVWDLLEVEPGCHAVDLAWRAWHDCGLFDDGRWGPWVAQTFEIAVRDNHWVSGDLHVHTRHSERGPEAGAAWDYYQRMINAVPDDLGQDFSDRRLHSLRGRLHWLVFSDHTNNELEECGRHFSPWCGDGPLVSTGRDVVRAITENDPSTLLVVGSEISNVFGGHFGFLPKNPYPEHPVYAPGHAADPTDYEVDVGFGPGVFRDRWVDETATNAEEIDLIHQMNALAIVNHEQAIAPWIEYDWSSLAFDGLEVWNGGNRHDQEDDNAYNGSIPLQDVVEDRLLVTEIPERPIERSWIGMLKTGRWPVALVGGSDIHDFDEVVCGSFPCDPTNAELASPTTTVWAPSFVWTNGRDGVVDAIAAGRAVIHDRSNFIDLRIRTDGAEFMVGDTIEGHLPGLALDVRAFGRVSDYVDGDNRILLILGTNADPDDPRVDVLYDSVDTDHFVERLRGTDHNARIYPDSSFDRRVSVVVPASRFGRDGTYYVWAQFLPWHNPVYLYGMGRDMAETGAIRVRAAGQ